MRHVPRRIAEQVIRATRDFPAIVLTGPRRAGKTWLLRRLFPEADYVLLEDPDVVSRIRSDPQAFLDALKPPVILDEVQNTPELLAFVRARIDREPRRKGRWILTGSQEAPLMRGVTESMAGRAAVLQLLPFSTRESSKVSLLRGGFPEVLARPGNARLWFSSYLQTYLERDVRTVLGVRDLATFRRFMALLASRHGQPQNKTDLAAPIGVSVPTITQWIGVLETTAQILIVPPFYDNLGKRLVKSPRIYIADSGLACHLLGIDTAAELAKSPFRGVLFEGLIASEIVKSQASTGRRRELYYFRDEQGLEVDFMVPGSNSTVTLLECKSTRTVTPAMASSLRQLADVMRAGSKLKVSAVLVHESARSGTRTQAVAPGVSAIPWTEYVTGL